MRSKNIYTEKNICSETNSGEFNPFPGLRPFTIDESYLFFGREGQSDEVLEKLSTYKFVAIIGSSGSGKSSLMYCGLTPILYGGFLTEAGSVWRMVVSRPGGNPIQNLATALVKSEAEVNEIDQDSYFKQAISTSILNGSSLGIIEVVKLFGRRKNENILLMIDQFEELFRYQKASKDAKSFNESLAFVKLLIEAVKQNEVPIYVIITMRSDFIGECAKFQELTKLINDSHYLIPQMTRNNFHQAIVGPISVAGGSITQRLVYQLLNDVGDNPDQLPILQHALMRTWNFWRSHQQGNEPMDIIHYEAIGKMEKALSEHANEAYDELDERGKFLSQKIFKTITEKGNDNRGVRNPTKIKNIAAIAVAEEDEIIKVVKTFCKEDRTFLTLSSEAELTGDTIIDISHESLMRIWEKLIVWVEEEAAAIKTYLRLSEAAENYQQTKTGLWRPPDLHLALDWRDKQKPSLAWGKNFSPAFEQTMVFLESSEREFLAEEENKIRQQKQQIRKSRLFAIVLGIAAILSLGLMLFAKIAQVEAKRNEGKAKIEKINANKQRLIADLNAKIARIESENAQRSENKAKQEKAIAIEKTIQAEKERNNAKQQKNIAEKQKNIAELQKIIAQKNAKYAQIERNKAFVAQQKADTLRMLSIAKSMAVKSLQINRDTMLKALISYQAYQFNTNFKGEKYNTDIYSALYQANKKANPNQKNNIFNAHTSSVRATVIVPNTDFLISAGSDKKIIRRKLSAPSFIDTLANTENDVNRFLSVSQNGKILASGTQQGKIQLFDLQNNNKTPFAIIKAHKEAVIKIDFLPDNESFVTLGADKELKLWIKTEENYRQKILSYKAGNIKSFDIDEKGNLLAIGSNSGNVLIWNIAQMQKNASDTTKINLLPQEAIYALKLDSVPIYSLSFNHKSTTIACGDERGIVNIFKAFGKDYVRLTGQNARIIDLKFSKNDSILAAASFDGTVQLWQTHKLNSQAIVLRDDRTWAWSVSFTNDDKEIIVGYKNGSIQKWAVDIEILAQSLKPKLKRNFRVKEWDRFVGKDILPQKIASQPFDENMQKRIEKLKAEIKKQAKKEDL